MKEKPKIQNENATGKLRRFLLGTFHRENFGDVIIEPKRFDSTIWWSGVIRRPWQLIEIKFGDNLSRKTLRKAMILRKTLSKRLVASRGRFPQSNHRFFHAGSKLNADALDMVDTFDRRHSKFCLFCFFVSFINEVHSFFLTQAFSIDTM